MVPAGSGTKARLRGLAVVDKNVVWASGTQGTYVRTTTGGAAWKAGTVPGANNLDFRDIHAVTSTGILALDRRRRKIRIYQTTRWWNDLVAPFTNPDPRGFLDAIAFWDADHGSSWATRSTADSRS